jgi:glyoxylase-like metal-dependent hydrolase (beta-lactamase superfamily II)/rhodanese-related sulfurtransferase
LPLRVKLTWTRESFRTGTATAGLNAGIARRNELKPIANMDENLMTIETLQEKLNKNERVFILDVRPQHERAEWRIAESAHVDAYKSLRAGDETALDMVEVPPDATVVTVCAAGRTSLLAAELLEKKGIHALSLAGGMKAWNYAWNSAEVSLPSGVRVIQVRRSAKGILSYVLGSQNEAVVIDAALDPKIYLDIASKNGWTIKYAVDTHIHADYVSRTGDLAKASGAKHALIDKAKVDFEFVSFSHGDKIKFGNAALEVIHTPGHTWESTSFKLDDDAIITGDTLFIDSVGRPDLKADPHETSERAKSLFHSVNKLLTLKESVLVLPGHTADAVPFDSKLVGERISSVRKKIQLSTMTEAQFIEHVLSKVPPTPPNYLTIAGLNKQGAYNGHDLSELEAGGNHCAIA